MRRILFIISVLLLCSIQSVEVYSQNIYNGTYTADEFLANQADGKIILQGNVTVTETININSKLTLDLNGYVLRGNLASGGYVLRVDTGGELIIEDSNTTLSHRGRFDSNGLYVWPASENDSYLKTIQGGFITNTFKNNATNTQGIYVSGKCIMRNGKIVGCYANGNGAAITVTSTGSFVMSGGEISYNYAVKNGGGIYGCNVSIDGTNANRVVIKNNRAENGGGVYLDSSSGECTIRYCILESNYATKFGGGIYSAAATNIVNSEIIRNRAMTSENGGVNFGRGGGFCFIGSGTAGVRKYFSIKDTEVSENACMYYGGGGHIASNAYLTMEGENCRIYKNESILGGAGGLHVTGGATFKFNDGSILENKADECGGGIHSSYGCELILIGGEIRGNIVTGRGGGVHINTGGTLDLNGTDILGNKALKSYNAKFCDVIFNQIDATYSWGSPVPEGTEYDEKTGFGGGVVVDAGICTMHTGSVSSNYAESGGGGIALVMINTKANQQGQLKVGQYTMNDGIIEYNKTDGNGAGIYLMKNVMRDASDVDESIKKGVPQITINKGVVSNNEAEGDGGGIYQDEETKFTINGTEVTFDGNKSLKGSGGAVYLKKGEAIINGGTISNNFAEINGGGMDINGKVTMSNGAIYNNSATNGGGIHVEAGDDLLFENCEISKNSASRYGGGVYVANEQEGTIVSLGGGSVFYSNIASVAGGGLAVVGPIVFNFNGSVQNNSAQNGGGIYLADRADLNFQGGFIRNNIASGDGNTINTGYYLTVDKIEGFGGGVFLDNGTTLTFPLNDTSDFGFYGNTASTGGDDIFANGNGTNVDLPYVGAMKLAGFDVPTAELYWVEDYVMSDSHYADGSCIIKTVGYASERYQHALSVANQIGKLEESHYVECKDRYLCLALGYDLYYLELQKKGLKAGETAIVNISYDRLGVRTVYREILLVGKGENQTVSTVVVLPPNTWYFNELTDWSWKYKSEENSIVRVINDYEDVLKPVVFVNNYQSEALTESEEVHIEVYKENRMKCQ